MSYVIGIDGGGTKTIAVLADEKGRVAAQATGGPTNPNVLTDEKLTLTIKTMLKELAEKASAEFATVTHLFAGISGAAGQKASEKLTDIFKQHMPGHVSCTIAPDPINALYSGTYGDAGIVQIAGTGSITYGVDKNGVHARAGGWGYLFGDEGSGYDLGKRAVIASTQAMDGTREATVLSEKICTYFGTITMRDAVEKIYGAQVPKEEIAKLSPLVLQSYHEEDPIAVSIVSEATEAIVHQIQSVKKRLFPHEEQVPLVLAGGVFSDEKALPVQLKQQLSEKEFDIRTPELLPVGGSVIGALVKGRNAISGEIIHHLKAFRIATDES